MSPNGRCTRSTVYDSSSQKLWWPIRVKRSAAATATSAPRTSRSLRGTRRDVQPHVVDLRRHPPGHEIDVPVAELLRELLQVVAEADGADVVARLGRCHRPLLEPGVHVLEAGVLEPAAGLVVGREVPRADPALQVRVERLFRADLVGRLVEALDVPVAAVLRLEPAAGPDGCMEALEQLRVVGHPVEDGV